MAKQPAKDGEPGIAVIATNRRARFDYELGERFEAGLVLIGSEVKSLRNGSVNIAEAWATICGGEVFIEGMRIGVLKHAAFGHSENRPRKLLLHARQIRVLTEAIERRGLTLIPTRLYFKHGHAKIEIAIAKGKRKGDKREDIKRNEAEREAKAAMDRARKGR